jgi:hypothetical protein
MKPMTRADLVASLQHVPDDAVVVVNGYAVSAMLTVDGHLVPGHFSPVFRPGKSTRGLPVERQKITAIVFCRPTENATGDVVMREVMP